MDTNHNIIDKIFEIYNDALKLHVNNDNIVITFDTILAKLTNLIKYLYGIVVKYDENNETIELLVFKFIQRHDVPQRDIDDICKITNFIHSRKKIPTESIIMNALHKRDICVYDGVCMNQIIGVDDHLVHTTDMSILAIPAMTNNKIYGEIILCNSSSYGDTSYMYPTMFMFGTLLTLSQRNAVPNQLCWHDVVNSLDVALIITSSNMNILCANDSAQKLLNNSVHPNTNIVEYFSEIDHTDQTIYTNNIINVHYKQTEQLFRLHIKTFWSISENFNMIQITKQNSPITPSAMLDDYSLGPTDSENTSNSSTPKCEKKQDSVNKSSNDLMAYLSHELRNPIQTISTGVYVLDRTISDLEDIVDMTETSPIEMLSPRNEKKLEKSSDRVTSIKQTLTGTMKRVEKACKNMCTIVEDVLDLSKIDNHEFIININEVDVRQTFDALHNEFVDMAAKKSLNLTYSVDKSVPDKMLTDETRLFQILSNLLTNSIKYSDCGTILLSATYDDSRDSILFSVEDHGKGIKKDEMNKLFKKYGRTSSSLNNSKSNGLGLYVSQQIAHLLGGSIEVMSENGTRFTLIHPCSSSVKLCTNSLSEPCTASICGTVLIVNNDSNITSLFKLLLQCMCYDKGYDLKIESTDDITKIDQLAQINKYGLIFIDIDSENADHKLAQSNIKTNCNSCPIIAITSDPVNKSTKQQFSDVILKPFSDKDVAQILKKYLTI